MQRRFGVLRRPLVLGVRWAAAAAPTAPCRRVIPCRGVIPRLGPPPPIAVHGRHAHRWSPCVRPPHVLRDVLSRARRDMVPGTRGDAVACGARRRTVTRARGQVVRWCHPAMVMVDATVG